MTVCNKVYKQCWKNGLKSLLYSKYSHPCNLSFQLSLCRIDGCLQRKMLPFIILGCSWLDWAVSMPFCYCPLRLDIFLVQICLFIPSAEISWTVLATSWKETEPRYHNYYWRAKLEDLQTEATSGAKDREMFSALDSQDFEKSWVCNVFVFWERVRDISE